MAAWFKMNAIRTVLINEISINSVGCLHVGKEVNQMYILLGAHPGDEFAVEIFGVGIYCVKTFYPVAAFYFTVAKPSICNGTV